MKRREFLERAALSALFIGIEPWKWTRWLYPNNTQRRIDALLAWDEVGEAVAATVPQTHRIVPLTKLGDATLAGVSHGINYGNATWQISETTAFPRPASLTTTMLKVQAVVPGSAVSGYRIDWIINQRGADILALDFPVRVLNVSSGNIAFNVLLSETAEYTNYWLYRESFTLLNAVATRGGYFRATRNLFFSVTGTPNVANTFTRIRVQVEMAVGQTGTVLIGPPLLNAQAVSLIGFSFDDTNLNDYTNAFLYMQARGVKGSSCVNTTFGTLPYANMREMAANGMWSIHNHTARHSNLPALDAEDARNDIVECRDVLRSHRIDSPNVFVPPFGAIDAESSEIILEYYKYIALAGGNVFGFQTADGLPDEYVFERIGLDSNVPVTTTLSRLDNTILHRKSICFYGHNPNPTPTIGGHTDSDDLHTIVDAVARYQDAGLIESVTLEEFVTRMTMRRKSRPLM